MRVVKTISELKSLISGYKQENKTVGLVPTMGALHAGHKSLVDRARKENDIVVVSVFVNPTQFNNKQDLATYPRTEERDCALLEAAGCDVVFMPAVEEVYPEPDNRQFDLGAVAEVMEGAHRPGHFNGVAQIVRLRGARPCILRGEGLPADCRYSQDGAAGGLQIADCGMPDKARGRRPGIEQPQCASDSRAASIGTKHIPRFKRKL